MANTEHPVVIVGAGLAGLCCARALEAASRQCLILEAADDVGGRMRTDKVDGFLLDRGFQVFNDAYPEAKAVLDYEALDLQPFEPGALTRLRGRDGFVEFVDPFRRPSRALKTALSPAATFGDKLRVARLRAKVLADEADDLLSEPEQTTIDFLHGYGFSDRIIESFFRPFFGGVFLDRTLSVSSRLFLWLYRMFSTGSACVPAAGMGAIPRQIYRRLRTTEVRLKTAAAALEPGAVRLADGTRVAASAIVVATEAPAAAKLLGERAPDDLETRQPRQSTTIYFAAPEAPTDRNLLILSGEEFNRSAPVNSLAVITNAAPSYGLDGGVLLSVSMIGLAEADDAAVIAQATTGLAVLLGERRARELRHIKTYRVAYSLPDQSPPGLDDPHKPSDLGEGIYLCGDHRDTASINGAMLSGRRAAEAICAKTA